MNIFDSFAMREALRRAQEMDTPAMRAALKQAEMMDTPAMREASRQAEMMNTPAIREASRQAEMMNTPAIREASRRAEMMNTPAIREASRRAEMMDTPAMREASRQAQLMDTHAMRIAEERARTDRYAVGQFRDADLLSALNSIKQQAYWQPQRREASWHSFFSSPAFNSVSELIRQTDRALQMSRSPEWDSLSRFDQHHRDLVGRTHHAFNALSEVTQFINDNRRVDFFPHSFADEVLQRLSKLEEPVDNDTIGKFILALENLFAILIGQSRKLAPGSISYNAILNYALMIAIALYTLYYAHESEQRIIEAVERARTEISKEIKGLAHANPNDVFFVTLQDSGVRNNPDLNEKSIRILSRNQLVRVIQEQDKWLYVEYFDYIQGIPKMGWIPKDCAARIQY